MVEYPSSIVYGMKVEWVDQQVPWREFDTPMQWWTDQWLKGRVDPRKYRLDWFPVGLRYMDDGVVLMVHPLIGVTPDPEDDRVVFDPRKLKASNSARDLLLNFCRDFGVPVAEGEKPRWHLIQRSTEVVE